MCDNCFKLYDRLWLNDLSIEKYNKIKINKKKIKIQYKINKKKYILNNKGTYHQLQYNIKLQTNELNIFPIPVRWKTRSV